MNLAHVYSSLIIIQCILSAAEEKLTDRCDGGENRMIDVINIDEGRLGRSILEMSLKIWELLRMSTQ